MLEPVLMRSILQIPITVLTLSALLPSTSSGPAASVMARSTIQGPMGTVGLVRFTPVPTATTCTSVPPMSTRRATATGTSVSRCGVLPARLPGSFSYFLCGIKLSYSC